MKSYHKSTIYKIFNVASGNFFEMYDFMVFGMFAPIIADSFFPNHNHYLSLILALATFGSGFLMRPLGAIFLGAYIDKNGRKNGLLLTLSLMAIGTITIAICPSYASIGITAPLLILSGRLIQGFSAGAELGGVSVYLAEIAPPDKRGFFVSWQSASQQLAVVVAALFGFMLNLFLTTTQIQAFGWRIPFIIGCLVIPLIFMWRSKLEETEVFLHQAHKPKLNEVINNLGKSLPLILLCSLLVMLTTVSFYMITAYTPTYAKVELNFSQRDAFLLTFCIGLSNFILLPIMGTLSDRFGRFKLLLLFSSAFILSAYPVLSWLIKYPSFTGMLITLLWLSFLYAGYNGSMVVALTEIVSADIRSTSFSFAYSIATAIYGGFTPLIATQLIYLTGNKAMPGAWLSCAALISFIAILLLKHKNKFK